jgi:hypothetical protein
MGLVACDADPDGSGDPALEVTVSPEDCASQGHAATFLGSDPYSAWNRTWTVHRVRITRPDGARTYAQFIPSDRPGPRPLVVHTMPYAGIDWTGEALDQRWAATAPEPGGYLDVDGPGFDGVTRIGYRLTPVAAAGEEALPHLLNDAAVLLVYGRFYAGGSVRDDVDDMRAGMWLTAELPGVDRARIGTFGASWGGFESLQAGAHGDARAPARVTVALFPPVDFTTWGVHAVTRAEPARGALAPYVRRLYADIGGPPPSASYRGLRAVDLCAGLPADTLVLHDEIDNLVPVTESRRLIDTCGADAVWWPRATMPDAGAVTHGPLTDEPLLPSVYLYAWSYLHLRLARPDELVLEVFGASALAQHLASIRDAQRRGQDVSFAAPRLRELCDLRLYLLDVEHDRVSTGAATLGSAVNAVWGTAYTEATIADAIAGGLPP